jgi:phosphoglycerate dehydrogenase-like enzyme
MHALKFLPLVILLGAAPAWAASDAEILARYDLRESPVPNWQKPKKIVVLADGAERLAWFQEVVKDKSIQLVGARNPTEFKTAAQDADAIIGICRQDVIAAAPKVRWVQTQTAGVEDCVAIPRLRSGEIVLTNTQRLGGPSVAEHAMALLLAMTRNIPAYADAQQAQQWKPQPTGELAGKTLLIAGLGGIGTEIAQRAHAFDMRVIATRNSGKDGPSFVERIGTAGELPELIGQADFVVNVLPLTAATTGLFNAAMFARMKPSAYFVNVGRGRSVVTDDLIAALNTRRIAGAGLDVFEVEPLPSNHALWKTPNVLITPHVANNTRGTNERMWLVFRENLRRYVAGEKLLSVVDAQRGY